MMRNWQLSSGDPLALRLAADVRQFHTDYTDDQIWDVILGDGQSPALALETRYGGRCGLARLVPMWAVDDRIVYEARQFASTPVLQNFTPGYQRLTARPVADLAVQLELWAISSHVLGGRLTFLNQSDRIIETGVDLFVQIMTESKPGEINILTLDNGQFALHAKQVGNLNPVILMHAVKSSSHPSPKLAARITVPPGEKAAIRWVHAARPDVRDSLALAYHWLYKEDWEQHLQQVRVLDDSVPQIETGDRARDAALAFSYRTLLGGVVGPTGALPAPSLVMTRIPARGFSASGNGQDHYWQWAGQRLPEMYSAALALASTAPDLAEGLVRNMLAVQGPDGVVDNAPGLGGQRSDLLAMPLLGALVWGIYGYSGRIAFLREVLPGLLRFYARWFAPEQDQDEDGVPEWSSPGQIGFRNHPLFSSIARYAQNVDIRFAESPGLVALLIREGRSLQAIAEELGERKSALDLEPVVAVLKQALARMWGSDTNDYAYRDRDTHITTSGGLIAEGPADQVLIPSMELNPPNRLVVRVWGGRDHEPARLAVTLEGLDANGTAIRETLESGDFDWYRSGGAVTSRQVYARIDRISNEGLSRVYSVAVSSVDWTAQDITNLLPLLAGEAGDHREALITALGDPARYGRRSGIPLVPADSPVYDPTNQNGCGGVWPVWNGLLMEGLLEAGRADRAADLFGRLLVAQLETLTAERAFREAYHPDQPGGLGDRDYVTGVVPLHVFWRLAGFSIRSAQAVVISGPYALPWPVRVRQYGVTVERTASGAQITFPSGAVKRIRSDKPRLIPDESVSAPQTEAPRLPTATPVPGPRPQTRQKSDVKVKVKPARRDSSDPFA